MDGEQGGDETYEDATPSSPWERTEPEGGADRPPAEPSLEEEDGLPGEPLDPLVELATQRDEYLDALLRLQADFDNFRKRTLRQQTELLERASASLLERLLPTLDAVDLAVAHASGEDAPVFEQIASLLRDALAKEGLERIDDDGVEFDPTIHDAVAHVPSAEEAEPSKPAVGEVLRAGYRLKGRVLRPAMVKVIG